MADVFKQLAQAVISLTPAAVYTAPASGQAIVVRTIVANAVCQPSWVRIWQGGSANTNLIQPQINVPTCARLNDLGKIMLLCGQQLFAQAELPSALTITFEGLEIT